MLKRVVLILIVVLSGRVAALSQHTADSSYFYKQSAIYISGLINNPALLATMPVSKIGIAKLNFNYGQGGLKPVQTAYKHVDANFYTEGLSTINRFKISGSFRINKVWEDSLAWTAKGLDEGGEPYYYFFGKAGKYERQNYNLNATLSYNLVPGRLWIASGLEYNYHWTTRSVDPRPDVKSFQVLLHPAITYRLSSKTFAGIAVTAGYGDEKNALTYKNDNFTYSTTYPERINYLQQGYGYIAMSLSNNNLRRFRDYKGLQLDFASYGEKLDMQFQVGYNSLKEDNTKDRVSSRHYDTYSTYELDTYKASTVLQKQSSHTNQQLTINLLHETGNDWNSIFNANNYKYQRSNARLSYLCLYTKGKFQPEWGISLAYDELEKTDVLSDHYIHYKYLNPGITGSFYYQLPKKGRLHAGISPSVQLPVNNTIHVSPTQVNVFTTNVVYPDYNYLSSTIGRIDLQLSYLTMTLFKQMGAGLNLKTSWAHQLKAAEQAYQTAATGKSRFSLSIGVNLYF